MKSPDETADVEAPLPKMKYLVVTTPATGEQILSAMDGGETASNTNSRNSRNSKQSRTSQSTKILVVATSLNDEAGLPEDIEERKAVLCCGVCCDLRRAVIIVDIVDIIINVFVILMPFFMPNQTFIDTINFSYLHQVDYNSIDDDEYLDTQERLRTSTLIVTILKAIGIFFSFVGIWGAYKFYKYVVLLTGIWYCVDVVRGAITLTWMNTVVAACFAYPHFALFLALRSGKMTKENYFVTEEHCCCERCVKKSY